MFSLETYQKLIQIKKAYLIHYSPSLKAMKLKTSQSHAEETLNQTVEDLLKKVIQIIGNQEILRMVVRRNLPIQENQ